MTPKTNILIMARGQGWVCVEKPWGISVHNDPGQDVISLLAKDPGITGRSEVLQPVHRLDKETSGLLLLALDHQTLATLSAAFKQGEVKKKYQALVHGSLKPGQRSGVWDRPLSKQAGGRADPRGRGKPLKAVTRFRVVEQSPHYTLVDIDLFTGRKHQIRRHAALAGHPVVGDSRYGSKRALAFLRNRKGFFRMALHAVELEFRHRGSLVTLESGCLPPEILALLKDDQANGKA